MVLIVTPSTGFAHGRRWMGNASFGLSYCSRRCALFPRPPLSWHQWAYDANVVSLGWRLFPPYVLCLTLMVECARWLLLYRLRRFSSSNFFYFNFWWATGSCFVPIFQSELFLVLLAYLLLLLHTYLYLGLRGASIECVYVPLVLIFLLLVLVCVGAPCS